VGLKKKEIMPYCYNDVALKKNKCHTAITLVDDFLARRNASLTTKVVILYGP